MGENEKIQRYQFCAWIENISLKKQMWKYYENQWGYSTMKKEIHTLFIKITFKNGSYFFNDHFKKRCIYVQRKTSSSIELGP